ncbi:hypothetical protein [Sunxiuqinia indica]|uniref:hypothetical protein n=1 Tax=Sunxiuqinia indica TaxID=2692584 RepID=UPI0013584082|nr:hypothetical protein [Sunxiuqinia indica]
MRSYLVQKRNWRLVLFLWLCSLNLSAQEKIIRNLELSFSLGLADYNADSLSNKEHVDWANYIGEEDFAEAVIVKWGARFDLFKNWKADMALTMQDDFLPLNLKLSLQYFPLKWIGVHGGFKTFHTDVDNGKQYFRITQPDLIYYFSDYEYTTLNNVSYYAGPVFNLAFGPVSWRTTINAGFTRRPGFDDHFEYKLRDNNKQVRVDFSADPGFDFMWGANSLLQLDCCSFGKTKLGLQVRTDFHFSDLKIDYRQRELDWLGNIAEQEVEGDPREFSWVEADAGVFLRF